MQQRQSTWSCGEYCTIVIRLMTLSMPQTAGACLATVSNLVPHNRREQRLHTHTVRSWRQGSPTGHLSGWTKQPWQPSHVNPCPLQSQNNPHELVPPGHRDTSIRETTGAAAAATTKTG